MLQTLSIFSCWSYTDFQSDRRNSSQFQQQKKSPFQTYATTFTSPVATRKTHTRHSQSTHCTHSLCLHVCACGQARAKASGNTVARGRTATSQVFPLAPSGPRTNHCGGWVLWLSCPGSFGSVKTCTHSGKKPPSFYTECANHKPVSYRHPLSTSIDRYQC
jgi:hypothetical protein